MELEVAILGDGEQPLVSHREVEPRDAALVRVIVADVLHVVEIFREVELAGDAVLEADEDATVVVVGVVQRRRRCPHVVTNRRPVLTGVSQQPDTDRPVDSRMFQMSYQPISINFPIVQIRTGKCFGLISLDQR